MIGNEGRDKVNDCICVQDVFFSTFMPIKAKRRQIYFIGINNDSTVSSVVQRIKNRIEKDKYLQREVDDVRIKVLMSQKRTCPPLLPYFT